VVAVRVCPRCRSVYAAPVPWCSLDENPLEDRDRDPLIGGRLDRYEIVELLGEGGMGRVYRGAHAVLDREYAIKVLFGDFAHEPRFAERFRREAQSISRVRHPNIVSVEDFGRTPEGLTFIALELVRGEPLDRLLERHGVLEPIVAAELMRQLVAGLAAAHAAGFVHRDIKPQNVMVSAEGTVKILDFGSVSLQAMPENERLTIAGNIVGTPTYMAPEQSQDTPVGPAADYYSLGVMLFEMLTGELPFRGRTRAEILVKHIAEPPPEAPPSRGLERLVATLLEKQPHARLADASQLLELLDTLPISAEPADPHRLTSLLADADHHPSATQTVLLPDVVTADLDDAALARNLQDRISNVTAMADPQQAASTPDAGAAPHPTPDAFGPAATAVAVGPPPEPSSPWSSAPEATRVEDVFPTGTPTDPDAPPPIAQPSAAVSAVSAVAPVAPSLPTSSRAEPRARPWMTLALGGLAAGLLALAVAWYLGGEPVRVSPVPPRSAEAP
jgi:serine/threonine-protein kinase